MIVAGCVMKSLLAGVVFLSVVTAGCSSAEDEQSVKGAKVDCEGACSEVSLPQENGMKMYLYLPFKLDEYEKFPSNSAINNPERYRHDGDEIFVSIYHGSMVERDVKVNFNMDTFMGAFENPEELNPIMKKKEKRDINGKEVTYADIKADFNGAPFRAECIGIYSGNEFWTILYFYNEKDKESQEVVKKSIDSITIH